MLFVPAALPISSCATAPTTALAAGEIAIEAPIPATTSGVIISRRTAGRVIRVIGGDENRLRRRSYLPQSIF